MLVFRCALCSRTAGQLCALRLISATVPLSAFMLLIGQQEWNWPVRNMLQLSALCSQWDESPRVGATLKRRRLNSKRK